MKSFKVKILLLSLLAWIMSPRASYAVDNLVGFWVAGAYSTMLHDIKDVHNEIGGVGEIGFTYELQHGHLLFNLGIGYTYQNVGLSVPNFSHHQGTRSNPVYDSEGDALIYNYNVDNRVDRLTTHYLPLQIMLGGQFGNFYFLAGGKFRLSMSTKTKINADITTTGTYPQFIDDFADMYNHAFFDHKHFTTNSTTTLNHSAAVSLELGWQFGKRSTRETGFSLTRQDSKIRYRVALFADYGLLNLHRNGTKPELSISEDFMKRYQEEPNLDINELITMNHTFETLRADNAKVNNLLVGLKFTMLFQLPHKGPCIHCDKKEW